MVIHCNLIAGQMRLILRLFPEWNKMESAGKSVFRFKTDAANLLDVWHQSPYIKEQVLGFFAELSLYPTTILPSYRESFLQNRQSKHWQKFHLGRSVPQKMEKPFLSSNCYTLTITVLIVHMISKEAKAPSHNAKPYLSGLTNAVWIWFKHQIITVAQDMNKAGCE